MEKSKFVKFSVINKYTIRLEEDAKVGDIIDLRDKIEIDLSNLEKEFDYQKDILVEQKIQAKLTEYGKQLEENFAKEKDYLTEKKDIEKNKAILETENKLTKQFDAESEQLKSQIINLESTIQQLNNSISLLNKDIESKDKEINNNKLSLQKDIASGIEKEISEYKEKLNNLKADELEKLRNEKDTKISQLQDNLNQKIEEFTKREKDSLNDLRLELEKKQKLELDKKAEELEKLRVEKDEQINLLKEKNNKLERGRLLLNNKELGEELEKWCETEFRNAQMNSFAFSKLEKDNEVIEGTKGDYIFSVYNPENQNEILTSVMCEMKNTFGKGSKKNIDHIAKLREDANKKHCKYALLVTELEPEFSLPIWRINYDNKGNSVKDTYVVRPQYFILFLSLIEAIHHKFIDELKLGQELKEQYATVEEIKDVIDGIRNKILTSQAFKKLDKNVREILDNNEKIEKNATAILELASKNQLMADELINTTIEKFKTKINSFKITKQKIKELSESLNKANDFLLDDEESE